MKVTLKIDGVQGNSTAAGHLGEIEIDSYEVFPREQSKDNLFSVSFGLNSKEMVANKYLGELAQTGKALEKATLFVLNDRSITITKVFDFVMTNVWVTDLGYDRSNNSKFSFKCQDVKILSPNSPKSWDVKQVQRV